MYDELARSQQRTPLEWFFLNAVIPSVVVTVLMSLFQPTRCSGPRVRVQEWITYEILPVLKPNSLRTAPVLVSVHRPDYPPAMRDAGSDGRVLVAGIVEPSGRVRRSSIQVLRATNFRFNDAAKQALGSAVFWPALWLGEGVEAPVTMAVEFKLSPEVINARH